MSKFTEVKSGLIEDLNKLRTGELSTTKAFAICRHINALVKTDSCDLQRERIQERKERLIKKTH